jgi:signal transduction histidine kinase
LNYLLVGATKRRGAALPDVLAEARAVISHLLPRVHDLSLDLRPPNLDDFGLLPSLSWLFERHARQTGLQVTFVQSGLERRFRPEIEMATYRIVQETLTNVARHAGVARADVRARADREKLRLTIRDQGHGFDPDTALAGGARAGLIGMRERALLLGGKLSLASAPGAGARLTLELPLDGAGEGGVTAGSGRLSRRPNGRARSPDPPASFV